MPTAPALPSAPFDASQRRDGRVSGEPRRSPARRSSTLARTCGLLGLVGIVVTVFLIVAGAAGEPSQYVPGRSGGWPGWMAGPLEGLGLTIGSGSFQTLT